MKRPIKISLLILLVLFLFSGHCYALDSGLFRTIPVDTPQRGALWMSNTMFYAPIPANTTLKQLYGVNDMRLLSNLTSVALGITNRVALTGTVPFYADMFTQGRTNREKTGPGDIAMGLRMSFKPEKYLIDVFTIGASASIPEHLGYGKEPLGFRTFSTSEFAYSIETSFGFGYRFLEGYLSAVIRQFPYALKNKNAYPKDIFYESSTGYIGIGITNASGLTDVIFQDHLTITTGTAWSLIPWLSGIVELSATSFTEKPKRDMIVRAVPGFRLGRPQNIHFNAGVDFRIGGPIPVRTYIIQATIPFLRPRALKIPAIRKKPVPDVLVRSRNSLVVVKEFSRSDITYLYESELKDGFRKELNSMGIMNVIGEKKVNRAFKRMELVPLKDKPKRLGIRLGANYLINTDITEYTIDRTPSFKIPLVIGFPQTTFSLSARASVTDLVNGETHDLGIISAKVKETRGVNLFPKGASSDIVYLSDPERRLREKELVDRWVKNFNKVILENLDVFGWEPKRTEIRGDEEISG